MNRLPSQHTFVQGCYCYYRENYYEPGNNEDGIWEDAHYPEPDCLGGTVTIKLLKHHHAIQAILQSEEYSYPCIFGWELKYLPDEYIPLFYKWTRERNQLGTKSKLLKRGIAFELLPRSTYWGNNPSAPKPILIHYIDGDIVYAESIKHASRITNIPQSTIQRRLKQSIQQQLPR